MKTIIGTKADVAKELTAQVAAVLASKPEANIAISAVDLPAEVLDALAASDIAFDRAALFQACEYCGAAGKGAHAVGTAFSPLTAAKTVCGRTRPGPGRGCRARGGLRRRHSGSRGARSGDPRSG